MLRLSQPFQGGNQQQEGDQEIGRIGFRLGGMANRMHADREDPDSQKHRERLTGKRTSRQSPEEDHAGQTAKQREEPQRRFRKSSHVEHQPLDPQVEQGGNLTVVKRLQKLEIAALDEVYRQEALIGPER